MALQFFLLTLQASWQRNWRCLSCALALGMITASSALADAAITFVCCSYSPTSVTITAGESVSWSGAFTFHPLRQVDGPNSDTPVPGGFANSTGTFYTVQFNTAGTYYYQCANHGLAQFGGTMRGQIVVLPAGGPPGTLDIDANGTADALTDGLLIIRYLFGLTGTSLTNGALGGTATRTDPAAVKNFLDGKRLSLDIDGNGTTDALTDGLLIARYLFGRRGSALIAGAADPAGLRKTSADIEAYLLSLMPP